MLPDLTGNRNTVLKTNTVQMNSISPYTKLSQKQIVMPERDKSCAIIEESRLRVRVLFPPFFFCGSRDRESLNIKVISSKEVIEKKAPTETLHIVQ